MNRVRSLWVLLFAVALGCASEGGPVGTGISSSSASISGNVIDVQTTATTAATTTSGAAAALPPIRVSIDEVPNVESAVNGDGNFELSGAFSGPLTLRFSVSQFEVTRSLDVPAGSAVVLQDIELRPDGVNTQAVRQLDFVGNVDLVDCAGGTLLVTDRHKNAEFLVRLISQTAFVRNNGQAAACDDIRKDTTIEVQGQGETDRTITAVTVTLAPPPPPSGRPPVQDVMFFGSLAAINCDGKFIAIDDSTQRTRLHISGMTVIELPDRTPLRCNDLRLGDHIVGQGQLSLGMPGFIEATHVVVRGAPSPEEPLRFFGFVAAIDCTSGILQLVDVNRSVVQVQLLPTTVITRGNQQPAQCTDINLGNRVEGSGHLSTAAPGTIDAAHIMFRRHGQGPGGPS